MLDALLTGEIARFWMDNFVTIPGCALALIFGLVVFAKTGKGTGGVVLKGVAVTAAIATIPLTFQQVGLNMAISDMYAVTYCSMIGTAVALMTGVPFLFVRNASHSIAVSNVVSNNKVSKSNSEDSLDHKLGNINLMPAGNDTKVINIDDSHSTVTIGRSSDNDVVIDDPKVSRHHARIVNNGSGTIIEDIGSLNGISINGTKVSRSPLNGNSVVKVGSTQLGFGLGSSPKESVVKKDNISDIIDPSLQVSGGTVVREKAPSGNSAWFTVKVGAQQGKSFELNGKSNSIGRSTANDINISDAAVSRMHAVVKNDDGKHTLFDNGSSSGTLVNNEKVAGIDFKTNETLKVGETELVFLSVQHDQADSFSGITSEQTSIIEPEKSEAIVFISKGADAGKSFKLSEGRNCLGRGSDNNISLTDATVSRQHCVIVKKDDKYQVFELGSQSGTYVNENPVLGKGLNAGDIITMGKTQIEFTSIGFGN